MLEEVTLAAPAYVERFGIPAHPEKLDGHRMIGFRSSATGGLLPLEFQIDGAVREITLPATISVNAAESYFAAAKLGLGLIQVPRYHAEEALRSGELLHVLEDYPPTRTPVSMLYPRSRQLSPRVRVFIDWLVKVFAGQNVAESPAG
jgi:DNA-binding transcriptional LysR family regulator